MATKKTPAKKAKVKTPKAKEEVKEDKKEEDKKYIILWKRKNQQLKK